MNTLTISCTWKLEGPLHAGTGLSRGGYADRLIRRDGDKPVIPGDAVKGAIRMSAERLLRWLCPQVRPEDPAKSIPTHPVLRRLFQPCDHGAFYHFKHARHSSTSAAADFFRLSTTALDPKTHIARDETLRTIEASPRTDEFEITILGDGGNWSDPSSTDAHDAAFLAAALVATDSIGGKRGSGFGRLVFSLADCSGLEWPKLGDPAVIESLKTYLEAEAAKEFS